MHRSPSTLRPPRLRCALAVLLAAPLLSASDVDLLDLDTLEPPRLATSDTVAEVRREGEHATLHVATGQEKRWPGVTITPRQDRWDLSARAWVDVALHNAGEAPITVYCRVDNPGADGRRHCRTESETLAAGSRATITVPLIPRVFAPGEVEVIGMRGAPPVVAELDPSNVTAIVLFVADPESRHEFEVEAIRAGGTQRRSVPSTKAEFFPFIDELGQYIHADWPRKTHSVEELAKHAAADAAELQAMDEPIDRNRYGGWTAGPQLEATGFFRVEKHRGKWWLVDPEGRLFWSHGVDCVHPNASTPISDRESYYRELPPPSSPLARFYGRGSWAPHGYYRDHTPYRTYDFYAANLFRRHGDDWEAEFIATAHRRLRRWGLDTIGSWSSAAVCRERLTAYTAILSTGDAPRLEGSDGYWGKFPDVFAPAFEAVIRERLERERGASVGDPWCIGFYVDNELSWGDDTSLAVAALTSPPDQPAKRAMLRELESKYGTIDALDRAWETSHASWNDLRESRNAPTTAGARDDLVAFYRRTADTYFATIRRAIGDLAPGQLYLGCRFAWVNDEAARAATKHCDVVSYNRYTTSVEEHRLPDGADRPVIIGEFHFGALDRGLFHTGLRRARDQDHRAQLYEEYVLGALRNPLLVGTHWFQWKDQATTGRGDGENYQIGFVDVCDRPYPEIVRAIRRVADRMYPVRAGTSD